MAGKFAWKLFSEIDITDPFFDTLKKDYPEFESGWFPKGVVENRAALVFSDEVGLGAFVAMKHECEPITMREKTLPACPRMKISTLRLAERFRGQRLGEGALGLVLWNWQRSSEEEIYLTVFPEHNDVIRQVKRFGFLLEGTNERGELVFVRSRKNIDFSDPYKSFPFVDPYFRKGGYLIVEDGYHDTLFPYSELQHVLQEQLDRDAANGVSKVYIGQQWRRPHYQIGEPIFIYRKYTGRDGTPRYKSCVTSFCVVTDVVAVKQNYQYMMSFDQFCEAVGNKSVFSDGDLREKYYKNKNVMVIKMLYCGYFGPGNNKNMDWLQKNGLWTKADEYPAEIRLSPEECVRIWSASGADVEKITGR